MATRLQLPMRSIFFFGFMFITIPFSSSLPFIVLHEKLEMEYGIRGLYPLRNRQEWSVISLQVKKMKELSEGYNIVGLSQGNLIGRTLLEYCEGGPPVKNFISLAGPHAGTASVPLCGTGIMCKIADNLIKSEIYSNYVQKHLAPSGYLKIPTDIPKYLKGCKLLPQLNNEIPNQRNSTLKKRFTSLQNLVLIMFQNDTVLIPRETSWFGYYPDGAFDPVLPPQKTKLYTEDWIGLKTLDEAGKVKYISVPGKHLGISESDMKKYVIPYLEDERSRKRNFKKWHSSLWTAIQKLIGVAQDKPLLQK